MSRPMDANGASGGWPLLFGASEDASLPTFDFATRNQMKTITNTRKPQAPPVTIQSSRAILASNGLSARLASLASRTSNCCRALANALWGHWKIPRRGNAYLATIWNSLGISPKNGKISCKISRKPKSYARTTSRVLFWRCLMVFNQPNNTLSRV